MRRLLSLAAVALGLLLLFSCGFSHKIATAYLAKHPDILAMKCAETFPCIPEPIRKGDTIRRSDTTYLPGNSVPCLSSSGDTMFLPCPRPLVVHDSVFVHDTLPIIDSARIRALMAQKDSLSKALASTKTTLKTTQATLSSTKSQSKNRLVWIIALAGILGAGTAGWLVAKFNLL